MKIGVDIRVLMDEHYSGISEYTANLLAEVLNKDKYNKYKLFYNSGRDLSVRMAPWTKQNSALVVSRIPNKLFNYLFQKIIRRPKIDKFLGNVDIFWSPHFNFTRLSNEKSGLKKIITVHDLSFLRHPEFFSWRKRFWHFALGVKKTLKAADKIIAVSESTKNEIMELLDISQEKIQVIYSGNNVEVRAISDQEKKKYLDNHKLQGKFILYLGNIEPRKNISGLISAYNNLRLKDINGKKQFLDLKLLLAGAPGWKNRRIYQDWKKSPYREDIKFLGYVNRTEREVLYSISSVFAYPSFYEGFGFPPLEALSYGLPVVCSNISSLPEIVGKAAVSVNPFRIEQIQEALELILTDEKLRQDLIIEGYKQVKMFSWEKTATEYIKVFDEISKK